MPANKDAVPPEIYQLKVTLLGTSPPIWRRLLVPADMTLAQLHDVLQAAMGWEERLPVDPNTAYPVCTDGQLACPPEDCGGIPGFYDLVEVLSDPNHERHEEMLDWIGEFDPQAFSVESVNRMLTPLRRRRPISHG